MITLLLLVCAPLQDPVPTAPPSATNPPATSSAPQSGLATTDTPARPWVPVDRVVVVVNQDIFTASRLNHDLQQLARARKLTTDTELRTAEMHILRESVKKRLRVQAGANLGVDEKLIDARVAESLEQMQRRSNGAVGLAKYLESKDVSGPDVRRLLRDDIYEQIYRDGVTGDAPGPLGRVVADQYVRPGSLLFYYQQAIERPAEMEALEGAVGRVRFQQIVLDVESSGGREAALAAAQALAARVAAGEDMAAVAREQGGLRDGDGVTDVEEARLRELFPEIAAFTDAAEAGQLSAPIETTTRGKTTLRIVRFLDRQAAKVPDFSEAKVQETLRERAKQRLEEYRLDSGYAALLRASYVWPPEFAGR